MIPFTSFHFIRHGQTDWNLGLRMMGQTDIPLNETGVAQAHAAGLAFQNQGIEKIITSPLLRAVQTGEIIQSYISVPMDFHDGLKECSWGVMEGIVQQDQNVTIKAWLSGVTPEGGESLQEFDYRVQISMKEILSEHENVLIVAHGGVFCALTDSPVWVEKRHVIVRHII